MTNLSGPELPVRRRKNGPYSFRHSFLIGLPLPIVLLLLWEIAVRSHWVPSTLIASPSAVMHDMADMLASGVLFHHIFISLGRLILGLSFGIMAGLATGIALALWRLADGIFSPTIQLFAPVPVIAWTPLMIIIFGLDGAKIALIAVGAFFIMFFGAFQGVRDADPGLVEVARMYRKSATELVWHVLLPSATPRIFDALRLTLGMGWILLLVGEIIASSSGLGWLIWDSRNFSRSDDMIVGMITVGILGKLSDMALARIQAYCLRWRPGFSGQ